MANELDKYSSLHVAEEELLLYLQQELPTEACNKVERHLLSCELCNEAMDGLEERATELIRQDISQIRTAIDTLINRQKKRRTIIIRWSIAAAITVLLVSTLFTLQKDSFIESDSLAYKDEMQDISRESQPEESSETIVESSMQKEQAETEVTRSSTGTTKLEIPQYKPISIPSVPVRSTPANINLDKEEELAFAEEVMEPFGIEELDRVPNLQGNNSEAPAEADELSFGDMDSYKLSSHTATDSKSVIHGVIKDENGMSIPGVSVMIKDPYISETITDIDGNFEIASNQPNADLSISFIGYETKHPKAQPGDSLRITLKPDIETLSEVVAIGYGSKNKKATTGAASRIKRGETQSIEHISLEEAVAGVQITKSYDSAAPTPLPNQSEYMKKLYKNMRYPPMAITNYVTGDVVLQITVSKNGKVTEAKIIKGIGAGCDEEAIRLITEGGDWTPAHENGVAIDDVATFIIKFELPD